MESPRPAGEAGRGGSGSAGMLDRCFHSTPSRHLRPDLLGGLQAAAEARRSGEYAAADGDQLVVLLTLRLMARAALAKTVRA